MIKVVSFKICPFVQRVTALLEAKGIGYQVEYISLQDKPEWFLEISPHGQVPVLISENGTPIFESEAIVEYLEEAYPALQPELPLEKKAENRAWGYLASKNYLVQCGAQRSPSCDELEKRSAKLGQAFDKIERRLTGSTYFEGNEAGTVDVAWLPLLHRAAIIEAHSGYDFLGVRPKLKAWQAALLKTGLAEKSVSPDFEEAFAGFYLSEETYLGRGGKDERDVVTSCCAPLGCC